MKFQHSNVLITGGSRGIGLAIAKKCLLEGATVVITGRSEKRLDAAKHDVDNSRLHTLVWDIGKTELITERLRLVRELTGGDLDVLVNNAAILSGGRHFLDTTEETWDEIQATNMKGLVFLTQAVVKSWIADKRQGKVINISSVRSQMGVRDGPYDMSKWGLNGLTQGLGVLLAPHGISVNGIAPGVTDTPGMRQIHPDLGWLVKLIPAGRIGSPDEIAELAIFLMSSAANYIVGQTIVCDGGLSLKI